MRCKTLGLTIPEIVTPKILPKIIWKSSKNAKHLRDLAKNFNKGPFRTLLKHLFTSSSFVVFHWSLFNWQIKAWTLIELLFLSMTRKRFSGKADKSFSLQLAFPYGLVGRSNCNCLSLCSPNHVLPAEYSEENTQKNICHKLFQRFQSRVRNEVSHFRRAIYLKNMIFLFALLIHIIKPYCSILLRFMSIKFSHVCSSNLGLCHIGICRNMSCSNMEEYVIF